MTQAFNLWHHSFLFLMDICLTATFVAHVLRKWREDRRHSLSLDAGLAMLGLFSGASANHGSYIMWYWGLNAPLFLLTLNVTGVLLVAAGSLCLVRLFSTYVWGPSTWIWLLTSVFALSLVVVIVDQRMDTKSAPSPPPTTPLHDH